jgi:hypothetical protein
MEYATVITVPEGDAKHRACFFDLSPTDIPSAHSIRSLVHVAVNEVCDVELAVKVFRKDASRLPLDANHLCFTVFLIEFDDFAQYGVANFWSDNWLGGSDGSNPFIDGKCADCSGHDTTINFDCSFSSFAICGAGYIHSWGDEARRHVIHSYCKHGPR